MATTLTDQAENFALDLMDELEMQQFTMADNGSSWSKRTANVVVHIVADDVEAMDYGVVVNTVNGVNLWSVKFQAAPLSALMSVVDAALASY
jgi:hypothetical protein